MARLRGMVLLWHLRAAHLWNSHSLLWLVSSSVGAKEKGHGMGIGF